MVVSVVAFPALAAEGAPGTLSAVAAVVAPRANVGSVNSPNPNLDCAPLLVSSSSSSASTIGSSKATKGRGVATTDGAATAAAFCGAATIAAGCRKSTNDTPRALPGGDVVVPRPAADASSPPADVIGRFVVADELVVAVTAAPLAAPAVRRRADDDGDDARIVFADGPATDEANGCAVEVLAIMDGTPPRLP